MHHGKLAALAALLVTASTAPVVAAQSASAGGPRGDVVVTANQGDGSIHVIDAEADTTLARFTGFAGPHEVAVSPDGRWAVVSDYGTATAVGNSLVVIDLDAFTLARRIDLGEHRRPHDVHFIEGGARLVVTAEATQHVLLVDFAAGAVTALETRHPGSHMVAVTADGRRAFAANMPAGTITELDLAAPRTVAVHPAGKGNEGIAVTPDGAQVWSASLAERNVRVVATEGWQTLATLPADGHPYRVTISPDGRHAFVPAPMLDLIRVFDVATRTERQVQVTGTPGRVTFTPDGRRAYFPLMGTAGVGVFDPESMQVVRRLRTGPRPDGVGVSVRHRKAAP